MKRTIYAVLIGINNYETAALRGCVNDVFQVKSFLDDFVAIQEGFNQQVNYHFLLAPRENETIQDEAGIPYLAPTRKNIIESFSHFDTASAANADICLFYYSGHGSRQKAFPPFFHMESFRQFETLVCLDSRKDGGRDLIDKELLYLAWKTLEGRENLHFISIMDCCYAGGNFLNALNNDGELERLAQKSETIVHYKDFHGFELDASGNSKNGFYSIERNSLGKLIRIHVHPHRMVSLSACQEEEKSLETRIEGQSRGVFTHHLIQALRNGGIKDNYQQLMRRVSRQISLRNKRQNPLVKATVEGDKILSFFGSVLAQKIPFYPIVIQEKEGVKEWILLAGAIHNIYTLKGKKPTGIKVVGRNAENEIVGEWLADVKKINGTESILDASGIPENNTITRWNGMIVSMSVPKIKIGFAAEIKEEIKNKFLAEKNDASYYEIVDDRVSINFEIVYQFNLFYLQEKGKDRYLFEGKNKIKSFCECLNHVGKWYSTLDVGNENINDSFIKRNSIDLSIEKLEGKYLSDKQMALIQQPTKIYDNPEEISVQYDYDANVSQEVQPYIRLNIKSKRGRKYKVGTLFFSDDFGVSDAFRVTPFKKNFATILHRNKESSQNHYYPLRIYNSLGKSEAVQYLKFFIFPANYTIDLSELKQNHLSQMNQLQMLGNEKDDEEEDEMLEWITFTVRINLKGRKN